jgi:hypothetical protein
LTDYWGDRQGYRCSVVSIWECLFHCFGDLGVMMGTQSASGASVVAFTACGTVSFFGSWVFFLLLSYPCLLFRFFVSSESLPLRSTRNSSISGSYQWNLNIII